MRTNQRSAMRRQAGLITSLATAGGLLLGSLTAPPAPAAAAQPGPATHVRIASYNQRHAIPQRQSRSDLRRLIAARPGVIGLQEMSGRRRILQSLPGWRSFQPRAEPGQAAVPIIWKRARFRRTAGGSYPVAGPTWAGHPGAGPATVGAKWITYVNLTSRSTGRDFWVLNTHAVASVDWGGRPDRRHPRRLALYRRHMDAIKRLVPRLAAERRSPVFLAGDLNVDYRRDAEVRSRLFPVAALSPLRLRSSWAVLGPPARGGTHGGGRLIDYVFARGAVPRWQRILRGYASDHAPVIVGFRLRR
jgi:endonuclease/exonuclease/phosphatase family metal-dependent hydrolase